MATETPINNNVWKQSDANVFWGEIAPTNHLVQIYENDDVVMDALEGFSDNGLKAGDAVIIIATKKRLDLLNTRLLTLGYDLDKLITTRQYIPLDANDTLAMFMKDGWPDETLFIETVNNLISLARGKNNRKVRAYGEMVAILWEQGHNGATVQLETLWHKFCASETFRLFCAYPKSGFTQDPKTSIEHICSTHTMIVNGFEKSKTEVFYKNSQRRKSG
ncbi:MAG: hypothetical protein K0S53_691 [Bacteroidetes bacterium]|jgi:hypothetical protein|nr:hypothetical protein [Bacteroidota bacterium]MDF2452518.1 hypothetical protein [Bacteroidota bacterium]